MGTIVRAMGAGGFDRTYHVAAGVDDRLPDQDPVGPALVDYEGGVEGVRLSDDFCDGSADLALVHIEPIHMLEKIEFRQLVLYRNELGLRIGELGAQCGILLAK